MSPRAEAENRYQGTVAVLVVDMDALVAARHQPNLDFLAYFWPIVF